MFCQKCGKEIPPASTTCPYCAQTAISGDPLSASPSILVQAQPQKETPAALKVLFVAGGLLCTLIIALECVVLMRKTYPSITPEAIGYAIGTGIGVFLFPVIGVLIYAKANKKKHVPANLFGATCAFALLWSFVGILPQLAKSTGSSKDKINEHIATLAKEAAGQMPNSGTHEEFDDILKPFFADIKQFNTDYMAEVGKLENSDLEKMYGLKSVQSDAMIVRILQELHATQDIDTKYASMEPLLQKTKERLFASSASQADKEAFWDGFEPSFKKSLVPRDAANAKEQAWLNDSIAFYEFMRANENGYHLKNNKIIFNTTELLNEYNKKVTKAEEERKEFLEAKENFEKAQKEGLNKIGLKPSDLGALEQE